MKEKERLIHILPTFVIVALAIASFALYNQSKAQEDAILEGFTDQRNGLIAEGLQERRQQIETEYAPLFVDCDDRVEYDALIDTDSRTMTANELRRALELHAVCGDFFSNKSSLTLGFFKEDVDELALTASILRNSSTKDSAEEIVSYWNTMYELENEHATIYRRMVDIQEEYWTADFNKTIGSYSSEEREAEFGALNLEASQNLARLELIQQELQKVRSDEAELWKSHFE